MNIKNIFFSWKKKISFYYVYFDSIIILLCIFYCVYFVSNYYCLFSISKQHVHNVNYHFIVYILIVTIIVNLFQLLIQMEKKLYLRFTLFSNNFII
jgi:hypothetical protein